jgi:hypothetical protein
LHARPAREIIEVVTVAVFWFGIAFVLRWERRQRAVVRRAFDGSHVLAERAPVNMVRTGARHRVIGYVVQREDIVVLCGVLVALVGDVDESGASMPKENCSACARLCAVWPFG